jgi:5'-3' exonuclease
MNKERLSLIDLDTLSFLVAYNQVEKLGNRDNPDAVKTNIREFISTIQINTRADKTSMVYQGKDHFNFRSYFYPTYKANRPETPEFMRIWKNTIIEEYSSLGAVGVKVIESDDVLNIGYNKFKEKYDLIIVSADKDLNQIPGEHYNPRVNKSYFVDNIEAYTNLCIQTLKGDPTDNIQGIYKVGDVKAKAILGEFESSYKWVEKIHKAYKSYFKETWYSEYLKTKFLVTLLKDVDYNLYPFCNEVDNLFNIVAVSDFMVTNLFN